MPWPWPWYIGGFALAAVVLAHAGVRRKLLQGAGHVSALVNRVRLGSQPDANRDLAPHELLEALQHETAQLAATLGQDLPPPDSSAASLDPDPRALRLAPRARPVEHLAFFFGLSLGGALAALLSGGWTPVATLAGPGIERAFGGWQVAALLGGGLLVGFGTRMCGGCTAGHGLCGLGRLQPGSAAATAAFFGGGVIVARILEALWS